MVSVDLPLEIIGIAGIGAMILIVGFIYFLMYWLDMRSKNPELHVFNTARNKPFPDVVSMVDLSGRHLFFNAVKDKPYDVKLKKDDYGLLLDSRLASKRPKSRLEDGTSIMYYGTNFHFPIDPNGARAVVQLITKIRKEFPKINFIRDDIVPLELLTKSGDDLLHDAGTVLEMYPYEEGEARIRTPEELVETIEEIKGKLKEWRVEPGFFSMKDALSLLPIGTTSSDMKRAVTIEKINTQNELGKPLEWWKELSGPFMLMVGAIVVTYMILTAM